MNENQLILITHKALSFADMLYTKLKSHAFVTAVAKDPFGNRTVTLGKWCGEIPNIRDSHAETFSMIKAAELIKHDIVAGSFLLNPIIFENDKKLNGGIRYADENIDLTITVSNLEDNWDKLMSVLILYDSATFYGIQINHIGFSFPAEEETTGNLKYIELSCEDPNSLTEVILEMFNYQDILPKQEKSDNTLELEISDKCGSTLDLYIHEEIAQIPPRLGEIQQPY